MKVLKRNNFCKEFLFGTFFLTTADIGSVVFTPHLVELSTADVVVRAVVFVGVVVVGAVVAVAFVVVFGVVVVDAFGVVGVVVAVVAFVVVFVSQAVLAGQSQKSRAALKMRPAGQG